MFEPQIWKEVTAPPEAANCQLCELAGSRRRVIWGEGNLEAPVLVLLDNPGERETAEGIPYVCGTRTALQEAAAQAGLGERELFVTYVLKCRPTRKYDKPAARNICLGHLMSQLVRQKPRFVFCLGNVAVQSFFGDSEAEVKLLRGRTHEVRGWRVLVSYHPLAVRRRPNLMPRFAEDWRLLASLLASEGSDERH